MSESGGLHPSVSSASLIEVRTETHLVLKAFLNRTLTIAAEERLGNVGGAYKDHNKFSSKPRLRPKEAPCSAAEDVSSADEKKTGFKDLIRQLPQRYSKHRSPKNSPEREHKDMSPSSTSEDEEEKREEEKKQQKKQKHRKIRKKLSKIFRIRIEKDKVKEEDEDAKSPTSPVKESAEGPSNHPPEFYNEVAEKLDKIAQRSTSIKKPRPTIQPIAVPETASEKDAMIQQLAQLLSLEGDLINTKIQSDPFLRSTFARLSYGSFAKILDTCSRSQVPPSPVLPPVPSPTLQRLAVTMEVSRRIVTATGAVRMQGYAECYMENFAPWVKSHGGWENVDLEEFD